MPLFLCIACTVHHMQHILQGLFFCRGCALFVLCKQAFCLLDIPWNISLILTVCVAFSPSHLPPSHCDSTVFHMTLNSALNFIFFIFYIKWIQGSKFRAKWLSNEAHAVLESQVTDEPLLSVWLTQWFSGIFKQRGFPVPHGSTKGRPSHFFF